MKKVYAVLLCCLLLLMLIGCSGDDDEQAVQRNWFVYGDDAAWTIQVAQGPIVQLASHDVLWGYLTEDGQVTIFHNDGVLPVPEDLPPIVQLALCISHAVAIDEQGRVHAWWVFSEASGQFGQLDFPDDLPPIQKAAVNYNRTLLLTRDGDVLGFGNLNYSGSEPPQLPDATGIECGSIYSVTSNAAGARLLYGGLRLHRLPRRP